MSKENDMKGITKRGNSYRFTVSLGYDGDGKQIRKYTTFTPPLGATAIKADKLAKEAYIEFSNKCRGMKNLKENMKFSQLVDKYFEEYAPNELKPVTAYNYKLAIKTHILPVFGNMKVKNIDVSDVSKFLTTLSLSSSSCRKMKIIFSSIFSFGISQKYISENPCKGALYKKDTRKNRKVNHYTVEQGKQLIGLTSEYSTFNTIIRLLLFSGMRSGEALALKWSSISFEDMTIKIENTLTYADREWFLTTPKTNKSIRSIKVSEVVIEMLKEHKKKQDEAKRIVGSAWKEPDMIFTSSTGNFYDRSLLNSQFKRFLEKNNMPKLSLHGLRHTNASILINNGIGIKAISSHLGHCNINITGDIYLHMFEEYKAKIADVMESNLI